MNEKKIIEGRWRIFGRNSKWEYGILNYDPKDGLTLKIKIPKSRTFEEIVRGQIKRRSIPETVYGFDQNNNPVTLFGCGGFTRGGGGGLQQHGISAMRALIGGHYPKWGAVKFKTVSCKYTLLSSWINRRPIDRVSFAGQPPRIGDDVPREIRVRLQNGVLLKIGEQLRVETTYSKHCFEGDHYIKFQFAETVPISEILDKFLLPFQHLLTLFTGRRIYPQEIKFAIEDSDFPESIELLMENTGIEEANTTDNGSFMSVQFSQVEHEIESIMQRWYSYYNDLNSVLNLFFTTMFNDGLYLNHQFLLLAQAFEVYHNRHKNFSSYASNPNSFKRRISRVKKRVNKLDGEWLEEKLHYANQKTLANRLKDILNLHPVEVKKLIRNKHVFADKIRYTRNYYTHFDEKLKSRGKIATETELLPMTIKMQALLKICIFKDLGITGKPIDEIIRGTKDLYIIKL